MMAGSHLLDRVGTTTPQSVSAATEAFEALLDMMRPVHMQMALGNATEHMAHALAIMTLLYNMLTLHPAVLKNYLEAAANRNRTVHDLAVTMRRCGIARYLGTVFRGKVARHLDVEACIR